MNRFFERTRIQDVVLRVMDLDTVARFYAEYLGFTEVGRSGEEIRLSASGAGPALLILRTAPGTRPRDVSSPGLFHVAFLFPDRRELARTVRHVAERNWRFQGFADHGVSEAVYLADPEGNGLELYRDRPEQEWPRSADGVAMVTEPLDVHGLLSEAPVPAGTFRAHPDVIIGHIHLQVSDLGRSSTFYKDILGLEVTQKNYPGALFLAEGGYHHHVGLNVWNSGGSGPRPPQSAGLESFAMAVQGSRAGAIRERAGIGADTQSRPNEKETAEMVLHDADGITARIISAF